MYSVTAPNRTCSARDVLRRLGVTDVTSREAAAGPRPSDGVVPDMRARPGGQNGGHPAAVSNRKKRI